MNFNIKIKIRLGRRRTHVFKPSFLVEKCFPLNSKRPSSLSEWAL